MLSMYFKYIVSETLICYDFAYVLCLGKGAENPQRFQVEAAGMYLIKVYNGPMSLALTNVESGEVCKKLFVERKDS